jgi:hypothetical protein
LEDFLKKKELPKLRKAAPPEQSPRTLKVEDHNKNFKQRLMQDFLNHMALILFFHLGTRAIPLIVRLVYSATRDNIENFVNREEIRERISDLGMELLTDEIFSLVNKLLKDLFGSSFTLPPGLCLNDVITELLQLDTRTIPVLCQIVKNLTDRGVQSVEFQQILEYLSSHF